MVVKNWSNDPYLNCTPSHVLENYMIVEYLLVEENYDLIKEASYFEQLQVDDDYVSHAIYNILLLLWISHLTNNTYVVEQVASNS